MMLKPFGFNRADTGGGDVTAPTLSSPVDAANGATAATGSVDTNEGNGTLYWVVTQSATSPSAAQVKAGNDHTGSAGDDSGSQAVSGTGTQTLSPAPSGLTASTTYYIHYMHEDAATNQSSVSSADGFTTSAASFSPADLFAGAEDGFILAPGDTALNELWQEIDGSQSTASANGDLVGEVVCLTTSRAARAGITGNRPTRLSSGGVEAITFGPAETGFNVFSPALPVDDFAVYIAFRILGFNSGSSGEMTPVTTANGGTGNGLQMIMHSRTAGTPNTWEMGLFNVSTFNIDSPTAAFDENTFYRVCSQTPDTGNFYVNGSTDGSYADSEGGTDPSIGFDTNNSGRDVYGDIALMVIIDRALTAGEIAQLDTYAAGRIV